MLTTDFNTEMLIHDLDDLGIPPHDLGNLHVDWKIYVKYSDPNAISAIRSQMVSKDPKTIRRNGWRRCLKLLRVILNDDISEL